MENVVAWVGAIAKDEDGSYDGYVWPVSQAGSERFKLNGDQIEMKFQGRMDRDSVTLVIGGGDQANFCVDGSGIYKYRAFANRDEAVRWVETKARVR